MKTVGALLCFFLIYSVNFVFGVDDSSASALLLKCKMEVGASDEDLKLLAGKKMPTSHSGLCLLTCLYENAGIIKDGEFVVENLSQAIESGDVAFGGKMAKQYIDEVTRDCKDVKNNDKCILSRDIIMCAAESISRHMKINNKEL